MNYHRQAQHSPEPILKIGCTYSGDSFKTVSFLKPLQSPIEAFPIE
jgi:hypothetical protein